MSYTFRTGDLPKLDLQVDRGSDFKAWRSQWDAYLSLSGLDKEPPAKKAQALTLCFARETVTIVDNLGLTADQKKSVSEIVEAIQRYVDGQVKESVERRNFRRRAQQQGETFDYFLVSLRELAKTCKFCSDECTRKNIRDQIIEGIADGDTVEDLLKEKDLSLDTAISKCRAQEAAKKQRAEITNGTDSVLVHTVRQRPADRSTSGSHQRTCAGFGSAPHLGGRQNCPAFALVCHNCNVTGHLARLCKRKSRTATSATYRSPSNTPGARAIQIDSIHEQLPQISSSKLPRSFEPAPTVLVHISSLNGNSTVPVLPDSGADVSVAGPAVLNSLNEHPDNLLSSNIIPRAVNGTTMTPLGKLPVTISLGTAVYTDELHIYPQVSGALLSWKAAKGLNILPANYPNPLTLGSSSLPSIAVIERDPLPSSGNIMAEFPSVFDGQVKVMDGKEFRIELIDNAQPFCVQTPRAIIGKN